MDERKLELINLNIQITNELLKKILAELEFTNNRSYSSTVRQPNPNVEAPPNVTQSKL